MGEPHEDDLERERGKKRRNRTIANAEKNADNDIVSLMANPVFRRFMLRFREAAGIEEDAFTGNSQTYHLLGIQKLGRDVMGWIKRADPDGFIELLKQELLAKNKENSDERSSTG